MVTTIKNILTIASNIVVLLFGYLLIQNMEWETYSIFDTILYPYLIYLICFIADIVIVYIMKKAISKSIFIILLIFNIIILTIICFVILYLLCW